MSSAARRSFSSADDRSRFGIGFCAVLLLFCGLQQGVLLRLHRRQFFRIRQSRLVQGRQKSLGRLAQLLLPGLQLRFPLAGGTAGLRFLLPRLPGGFLRLLPRRFVRSLLG